MGSEVLQSLFENGKSPMSDQFIRWKLWARWEEIVGQTMGENTEPVWYDRGTLYLWVKSSTWMQQLIFFQGHIRVKVNKYLHRDFVKVIKFTLDRRSVPGSNQGDQHLRDYVSKLAPPDQDLE